MTFEFIDAGHVLGSAGVLLRAEGRTFFYSGDVNFDDQTIAQGAVFPESGIDVLIMECTRGDSPQPEGFTRVGGGESAGGGDRAGVRREAVASSCRCSRSGKRRKRWR